MNICTNRHSRSYFKYFAIFTTYSLP